MRGRTNNIFNCVNTLNFKLSTYLRKDVDILHRNMKQNNYENCLLFVFDFHLIKHFFLIEILNFNATYIIPTT